MVSPQFSGRIGLLSVGLFILSTSLPRGVHASDRHEHVICLQERLDADVPHAARGGIRPPVDATRPTTTLIITHPVRHVVDNYVSLVAQGVLNVPNLRVIGIFHQEENEDYAAAQAYIDQHQLDWFVLVPMRCPLDAQNIFASTACRDEVAGLLQKSHGMIFNGGDDIPPHLYGQPLFGNTHVLTPKRHIFETAMLVQLLGSSLAPTVKPLLATRPDYPILGICVGMQTMNIAAGGTLFQDVERQLYQGPEALMDTASVATDSKPQKSQTPVGAMQTLRLTPLAPDFMRPYAGHTSEEGKVLSIHHQAVDRVGSGYAVLATSADGKVVETIGRFDFPNVLGLQFHPERRGMWDERVKSHLRAQDETQRDVFETLLSDAASRNLNAGVWAWLETRLTQGRLQSPQS